MGVEERKARMKQALAEAEARAAKDAAKRNVTKQTLGGAAKALTTGVRQGSEALVGTPGDAPGMLGTGWSWLQRKLGATDEDAATRGAAMEQSALAVLDPRAKLELIARMLGMSDAPMQEDLPRIWPTSQEVHGALSEAYPDPATKDWTEHEPQGFVERGLQTVGQMAPNMLFAGGPRSVMSSVIAPTIGTEVGGAIGDQFGYEGAGRLIGGIGGSLLPGGVTRAMTGPPISGERARLVNTMLDEGVDLTAGQASGRPAMQYAEVGPYETKAAGIAGQQSEQFNAAALRRAGIPGEILSPEAVRNARDRFGLEYENAIRSIGGLPIDQVALDAVTTVTDDYARIMSQPSNAPSLVNSFADRIINAAAQTGSIPADVFQQIRSDISRNLRTIGESNPALSHSLEDLQDALQGSIVRNAPPGVADTFSDLNNRYRNFMILKKAMRGAGGATAEGNISPQKLRGAVENADPSDYLAGEGDFADLARAGEVTMKPLPQSGTAPRAVLPAALTAAAMSALNGQFKNAGIALAAPIIPAGVSSLLTSGPVRRALLRRITGEQGHLNPVASALTARQIENERGPR